jgi:hypothetical protein
MMGTATGSIPIRIGHAKFYIEQYVRIGDEVIFAGWGTAMEQAGS